MYVRVKPTKNIKEKQAKTTEKNALIIFLSYLECQAKDKY